MSKETNNDAIVIYQSADGRTKIDVRLEENTIWLTQKQIAELFGTALNTITEHIKHIIEEGELTKSATIRKNRIVQTEGNRQVQREVLLYNLDMIISVGYRVNSILATRFRQWATQRLHEYLVKGFTMDDERLKDPKRNDYFEELLARIRDIRSSEKIFYRKILDIYATSIDYEPNSTLSRTFFATVQNKIHFSTHGKTAAELIYARADSNKPFMGLTSWSGTKPTQHDTTIAKNYLNQDELDTLNRLVNMYLDFAELQAKEHKTMTMQDWITKLDAFLTLSDRELLQNAGSISHEMAMTKAEIEYEKYTAQSNNELTNAEKHFIEHAIASVEEIAPANHRHTHNKDPK